MTVRYIQEGTHSLSKSGNPTIVDNVATDFSHSDYYRTYSLPDFGSNDFEIGITVITPSTLSACRTVSTKRASSSMTGIIISPSGSNWRFGCSFGTGESARTNFSIPYSIEANKTYTIVMRRSSNMLIGLLFDSNGKLLSKNGANISGKSFNALGSYFYFGGGWENSANSFNGSIDFNKTWISSNYAPWLGPCPYVPNTEIISQPASYYSGKVLTRGELAHEEDTNSLKIGNGFDEYSDLPYIVNNEVDWEKPEDWIDLRSCVPSPESVCFLVGHSIPTLSEDVYSIEEFPTFSVSVTTTTGAYNVYIDGIFIGYTNSGSVHTINFTNLYNNGTLSEGFNVSYPQELTTHIVRVSPRVSGAKLATVRPYVADSSVSNGLLWAHFNTSGFVSLQYFGAGTNNAARADLCEAITSSGETLKVSSLERAFVKMKNLALLPILEGNNDEINCSRFLDFIGSADRNTRLKRLVLKNMTLSYEDDQWPIYYANGLREIIGINASIKYYRRSLGVMPDIRKIDIPVDFSTATGAASLLYNSGSKLSPTVFDLSEAKNLARLQFNGTSSSPSTGKKGLILSPEAPFDYATAPQLDVRYTNLNRDALVKLFKSIPYNVGYELVGSPTITDGVVSGFSDSNYVTTSVISPKQTEFNSIEIGTRIIAPSTFSTDSIFLGVSGIRMGNDSSGNISVIGLGPGPLATGINITSSDIYIKLIADTASTKVYTSADGDIFTEVVNTTTYHLTDSISTKVAFGYWADAAFPGSIDLNNTYIKVNGVPWFKGTAAMTKTCSIVGCAGTADLTADDKSIAEDKGWELVLS